jgi:hypothetical protein
VAHTVLQPGDQIIAITPSQYKEELENALRST